MKKKVNLGTKLALDKETISKLDEQQLKALAGGGSFSCNAAVAAEGEPTDDEMTDIHSCCNDSCNTK